MNRLVRLLFPKRVDESVLRSLDEQFERRLVSHYSRGNAHLHLGRYVTSEQTERMNQRRSRYRFI